MLVAAVLATALLPATPAAAANDQGRQAVCSGCTTPGWHRWPSGNVGSLRLWDTGTTWREIETLARRLRLHPAGRDRDGGPGARRRGHAGARHDAGLLRAPAATGRCRRTWVPGTRYVAAVVQRYRELNGKRGIAAYQVWNEANVANFWTGTPAADGAAHQGDLQRA